MDNVTFMTRQVLLSGERQLPLSGELFREKKR
jgi:hypothetical protein